jgi:pSer/pThr/pTyr-binding forkhead associated (FHA) protein
VNPQGTIIGRDPNCDVVIGYERASRRHTRITFDGQNYYVTDLNSTNGTYLGRNRLAPDTPELWTPNVPIRIGDLYFHLEFSTSYEQRQEEVGAMETMAGQIPGQGQAKGGGSKLWLWFVAGLGLLCGCAGLGTVAYILFASEL